MIDPHVHCRDWNQSYKETIRHFFEKKEKGRVDPTGFEPVTSRIQEPTVPVTSLFAGGTEGFAKRVSYR